MKIDWRNVQPRIKMVLAAVLVGALLITPSAVGPQVVQAQEAPAGRSQMAVVGAAGATLYAAPQGDELGALPLGTVLTAISRTADSTWIEVTTTEGDAGWVKKSEVVAFGLDKLPVSGSESSSAAPAATTAATTAVATVPAKATTVPTATKAPPTPTSAPTATAVPPTPTPEPTATSVPPTPTLAPTAVSTVAPTQAPAAAKSSAGTARSLVAVVGGAGAELYDIPNGQKLQDLPMAATLTAALRNPAGDWVFVTTSDGASGWTPVAGLVAFGLDQLPVLDVNGESAAANSAAAGTAETVTGTVSVTGTEVVSETAAETGAETAADTTTAATPEKAAESAAPVQGVPALVTITEQRLNIRSGPNSAYRILGKAQPGEELTATARTPDSQWVQVARTDLRDGVGWVAAEYVQVEDLASLPVDSSFEDKAPGAGDTGSTDSGTSSSSGSGEQGAEPALPTPTAMPETSGDAASAPAANVQAAGAQALEKAAAQAKTGTQAISAQPAGLSGKLVFEDGRNNIYVYNLETGAVNWLTNGWDPDVTRDGQRVTFMRGGGDVNGIWTINIDGSNERRIQGGGEIMRGPKWSPDGNWIVFSRNFDTDQCYDLGPYIGCLSFTQLQTQFPRIPPSVLYSIFLKDADLIDSPNWNLTRVNSDGGEFRDLPVLDSAVAPDWNEDGITYQAKPGIEVTQDKPDGQTRPVYHDGWDWDPDWQPGGGRIVYQSKEGSHWEIWSINPDGSGLVALTRPETTLVDQLPSNVAPAFSPDGQHIVYLSNRREDEDAGPWRLWVMNADGSNKRPLPIDVELDYGFSASQAVSWGQ